MLELLGLQIVSLVTASIEVVRVDTKISNTFLVKKRVELGVELRSILSTHETCLCEKILIRSDTLLVSLEIWIHPLQQLKNTLANLT